MIGGGVLIAVLTLENALLVFAVFTAISALAAVPLPSRFKGTG